MGGPPAYRPTKSPDPPESPDLSWPPEFPASVLETIYALSVSCVSVSPRSHSSAMGLCPPWRAPAPSAPHWWAPAPTWRSPALSAPHWWAPALSAPPWRSSALSTPHWWAPALSAPLWRSSALSTDSHATP